MVMGSATLLGVGSVEEWTGEGMGVDRELDATSEGSEPPDILGSLLKKLVSLPRPCLLFPLAAAASLVCVALLK